METPELFTQHLRIVSIWLLQLYRKETILNQTQFPFDKLRVLTATTFWCKVVEDQPAGTSWARRATQYGCTVIKTVPERVLEVASVADANIL